MSTLVARSADKVYYKTGEKPVLPDPISLKPTDQAWLESYIMDGETMYNSADQLKFIRIGAKLFTLPMETQAEVATIENTAPYDPLVELYPKNKYCTFENDASADEDFHDERLFRCEVPAPMGYDPENYPYNPVDGSGHWVLIEGGKDLIISGNSTAIGWVDTELAIAQIVSPAIGHTISLSGTGKTYKYNPDSTATEANGEATIKPSALGDADSGRWEYLLTVGGGGASTWEELSDTFSKTGNAKKLAKISDDEESVEPTPYDYDQVVNTNDIDVSEETWQESESRLLEVQKVEGKAAFKGATQLIDIFAPPGVDTDLADQSGWTSESKTLTGENYLGQLGKVGQVRILSDGTYCRCISSVKGTSGGADGSATYRRNRAIDTLDPDNNSQDSDVCDLLDPSRTGGTTDDGWNLVTNIKVITTVPCRVGTWWKMAGGYSYFCYAVSGSSYYFYRSGQPTAIYRYIDAANFPLITAALLAHDFSISVYTEAGTEETTYHDQCYYDLASRSYYVKVNATQWEQLR